MKETLRGRAEGSFEVESVNIRHRRHGQVTLSQIAPLGRIDTSDSALAQRLLNLITVDRALVAANGSVRAATKSIANDDATLNTVCPGVAP